MSKLTFQFSIDDCPVAGAPAGVCGVGVGVVVWATTAAVDTTKAKASDISTKSDVLTKLVVKNNTSFLKISYLSTLQVI